MYPESSEDEYEDSDSNFDYDDYVPDIDDFEDYMSDDEILNQMWNGMVLNPNQFVSHDGPLEYDSDAFFVDSEDEVNEGEEQQNRRHPESVYDQETFESLNLKRAIPNENTEVFEKWSRLPSEIQSMIMEHIDFGTWLNLVCCNKAGQDKHMFLTPSFEACRFSINSIIKEKDGVERERIRVRLSGPTGKLMVKFREVEQSTKFSWNFNNRDIGSVDLPGWNYLKVTERLLKDSIKKPSQLFKIDISNNKSNPAAPSLLKSRFFLPFLKTNLRMSNDSRRVVDNQFIVDFINTDINVIDKEYIEHDLAFPWNNDGFYKFEQFILRLPTLNASDFKEMMKQKVTVVEQPSQELINNFAEFYTTNSHQTTFLVSVRDDNTILVNSQVVRPQMGADVNALDIDDNEARDNDAEELNQ